MTCRFDGSVTQARLEGLGPVKLGPKQAFSKPFAARVELQGARINDAGPTAIALDPAIELEPVDIDLSGEDSPYKVTYRVTCDGAEPGFALTIDEGGTKGHARGEVPRAPECNGKSTWCDVIWEKGPKVVLVTPATAGSATLTGSFPFRKPGPADREATSRVTFVTALGARGELRCDGRDPRRIEGETLSWQVDTSGPLRVDPLTWSRGELRLTVESGRAPNASDDASDHPPRARLQARTRFARAKKSPPPSLLLPYGRWSRPLWSPPSLR